MPDFTPRAAERKPVEFADTLPLLLSNAFERDLKAVADKASEVMQREICALLSKRSVTAEVR